MAAYRRVYGFGTCRLTVNEWDKHKLHLEYGTTDSTSAFVVNPAKIFLTSSLITMQNLVVVSYAVCAHVRGPKN